jgi:hypothetical protein
MTHLGGRSGGVDAVHPRQRRAVGCDMGGKRPAWLPNSKRSPLTAMRAALSPAVSG